jgi:hypothetical protein
MEWSVVVAAIPNALEFGVGGGAVFGAALLVALAPVLLMVRQALAAWAQRETPQLRLIEGSKELRPRAA